MANGHHWDPRWPEPMFPGHDSFTGEQMHAHAYVDNDLFADKDVVILGMGNSAMDIAVESSYVARSTYLAARRGAWIIPKYMFGRPVDQLPQDPRVPFKVRQRMIHTLIKLHVGNPARYGLPAPDHKFGEAHPTVSGRILDRIAHGTIAPKPNIRRLDGDEVEFDDGSRAHVDVVVYCTGYKISFPFFDADFISAPDNHIELFRRVFHPEVDDVFFVALLQPLGATMPLAEAQGQWIADYLRGEYALPPRPRCCRTSRTTTAAMRKRYVASKRHTIQVDFDDYLHALAKERRAGAAARAPAGLPAARGAAGARAAGAGVTAATGVGKRERTKAANREAILVAARRVFSDLGYGAASVRDIVRETDLATGTFYNYFPDKESVLRALVDEITGEARARVRAARTAATTLEGFVAGGFRAYFEFLAEDPGHGRADAPQLGHHPHDVRRARAGRGHRRAARRPRDGRPRRADPAPRRRPHGGGDGGRRRRGRPADGRARAARRGARGGVRHRRVPGCV